MATRKTTRTGTAPKAVKKATARKAPAKKAATKKVATKKVAAKKAATKKAVSKTAKKTVKKAVRKAVVKAAKKARPAPRKTAKAAAKSTKAPARKVPAKTAAAKSTKAPARKATKKAVKVVKVARKTAPRTAAKKPAPRKAVTRDTAQQRAGSSGTADKAERAGVSQAQVSPRTAAKPRREPASRARKPRITPEEALANTRELLEAKQARDREPPPWRQFDPDHGHPAQEHATQARDAGQEAQARAHAEELHRGESRLKAIQGSISEQDRHHQGRQDAKG